MLSRGDNELMCRVGRGTPMGELLRQYWLPCLPSKELPAPDGPPTKVRLLGEVNLQDRAMTETMGPIYDRTQEHLGTTDAMVIYVRQRLIDAARALRDESVVPANVDDPTLCRVRPASILLPEGDSWITATEKARQSDAGVPIAWVPFAQ